MHVLRQEVCDGHNQVVFLFLEIKRCETDRQLCASTCLVSLNLRQSQESLFDGQTVFEVLYLQFLRSTLNRNASNVVDVRSSQCNARADRQRVVLEKWETYEHTPTRRHVFS
jgi:hypothetical protein